MIKPHVKSLPLLHDPLLNDRVRIETIGGWDLYGPDRRSPSYAGFFLRQDTPLQLKKKVELPGGSMATISIITPCRATDGKFEFVIGEGAAIRQCCYRCVTRSLRVYADVAVPRHEDWIVYMLLESHSYMHGKAPKERGLG
jgi:hypothetical protein